VAFGIFYSKVTHSDLVFGVREGSLVGLCEHKITQVPDRQHLTSLHDKLGKLS